MTRRRWLSGGLFLLAATSWLAACEADLETTCVGGDGSCDSHRIAGPVTSASSGGGGAGGGDGCFEGCDSDNPSMQTGEFPCEIEAVMTNCRRCHSANFTLFEAPFHLDSYEQSQALFGNKTVWFKIKNQVELGFMPQQPPALSDQERADVIDWACSCGPPREPGVTCP